MNADCIFRNVAKKICRKMARKHISKHHNVAGYLFDSLSIKIMLDGVYEKDDLTFLSERIFPKLKSRSTCIDVGANIGNHALFFSDHFDRVIALEPHPRTYKLLCFNAELVDNILPLMVAASNRTGEAQAAPIKDMNMGTMSLEAGKKDNGPGHGETQTFKLVRLDDLPEVRKAESIDFIKIDVEGHELPCLQGARETLLKHNPLISFEIFGDHISGNDIPAVSFLRSVGYRHFYQMRGWSPPFKKPRIAVSATQLIRCLLSSAGMNDSHIVPLEKAAWRNVNTILCCHHPLPC